MTLTKVTYLGPLPEGVVQCPNTGKGFKFKRGAEFDLPMNLAEALEYQNAKDWKTSDAVKKAVADRRAAEAKAAEEAAKKAEAKG